jgi:hypothetical protein
MQLLVTTETRYGPSTISFKRVVDVDLYVAELKGRPVSIVENGLEFPSYEEWRQQHAEPRLTLLI